MKLSSKLFVSAFTALTFVAIPACEDKKEDKKDAKKDAKKDEKKDDKKDDKKDEKKDDKKEADGGAAPADAKADGGAAAADGGAAPADAAAGSIGVKECDDYITKFGKCIDEKMEGPAQESAKKTLATSTQTWKTLAATPAGKESLATACKTSAEAMKATCGW